MKRGCFNKIAFNLKKSTLQIALEFEKTVSKNELV